MSLKIGIVGLPNVGKSTLFNALVKSSVAEAANYPFCTIEPNVGIVDIPDNKLPKLAEIAKSEKIIPAAIEFVDIAGIVEGASKGEGLGNKFLSHIREVDAIILTLRAFSDTNVINTLPTVDPARDAQIIELELILADLESLMKRRETVAKEAKAGSKEATALSSAIEKAIPALENEQPARSLNWTDDEHDALKSLHLLTMKPLMVVLNVDEEQTRSFDLPALAGALRMTEKEIIPISVKIESEIAQLEGEEVKVFMDELGMKESGLDKVARAAYNLLGLQSYYTAGEKEARAWTIKQGSTAPQAASVIHTDFERGFIAAEIISYADFITNGGWSGGRTTGKVRTEGKTYIMQPDDVVLFRFNV